jgi:hypothetical protein
VGWGAGVAEVQGRILLQATLHWVTLQGLLALVGFWGWFGCLAGVWCWCHMV